MALGSLRNTALSGTITTPTPPNSLHACVHQQARENQYFTKEDERVLAKLYSKVKSQANSMDQHAAAGVQAAELSELKSIIKKYDVSGEDIEVRGHCSYPGVG